MQGLLFDLDGVLATGGVPLPGAIDTLAALRRANFPFLIVSNMTLWPRAAALKVFSAHGVDLPLDSLQTPPSATARWLRERGARCVAAFVTPATRVEFDGLPLAPDDAEEGADYVVVGDMGDGWTAQALNRALRLLLGGAQLISLGMGRYWKAPDGLRLDSGAFTSALAYATGQTPVVIGKPSADYFQVALDALGLPPAQVGMVGDDVHNDVEAAQRVGLTGILVRTGKFRPADLQQGVTPDHVIDTVAGVLPLVGLA